MVAGIENIKVRKVDFNVKDTSRYYGNGNIFLTHYINAMHIVFPEGEKFFIRSARRFMKDIKGNKQLTDRVMKFIGQEGVHHKEHEKFWDVLENFGLNPRPFAKFYNYTAYNFIEKRLFQLMGKKQGNLMALSVTTALEHFTALLGAGGLEENNPFNNLPKDLKLLLQWHAAEELEHKSVCYDLYEEVGGTYEMRIAGMVFASIFLWVYLLGGQAYFIAVDKEKDWKQMPSQLIQFWKGFLSSKGVKNLREMYLDYYKRDFHPDDHDNYHMAEAFFEEHKEYFEQMGIS